MDKAVTLERIIPLRRRISGFREAGLSDSCLGTLLTQSLIDPEATHVSASQHILLMLNSIAMTNDETHGLGRRPMGLGFASLGLRTMLGTASFGEALTVLTRYFTMCGSPFALAVTQERGMACIAFRAEGGGGNRAKALEEIWFDALFAFFCWYVGRPLPVTAALLAHIDDHGASRLHWAARIPITCGDMSAIYVPQVCLGWGRQVDRVEEPLWAALRFWMDGERGLSADPQLERLRHAEDLAGARASDILRGSELGDRQRGRSVKQVYGTNFRELRGQALVDHAVRLLRTTDGSTESVAAQLGYAEERSFRRFIRNRTGQTPAQIRRGRMCGTGSNAGLVQTRIHELTRTMDI